MNLLIDIGNSRLKWALWQSGALERGGAMTYGSGTLSENFQSAWDKLARPERVVVSSVTGRLITAELEQWVLQRWQRDIEYISTTKHAAGVTNGYISAQQLGVDRWAAIVAAYSMTGGACLVVDCGTATTLDVVDDDGCHRGGLIIPGVQMMVQSLSRNTEQISLSKLSSRASGLGQTTGEAITIGVVESIVALVEATRRKWISVLGTKMETIITGGDAATLFDGTDFQYCHEPDLVLRGITILSGMMTGEHTE